MNEETSAADKATDTMNVLRYFIASIGNLAAGSLTGGIGGLLLGWLFSFGYHRQGPSDLGHAPVYVAMGLVLVGACVGAIVGLIIGAIYSVRLARRKRRTR
jgi:ABC-type antimicrobial peptide transport system permease subunit